MKRYRLVPGLLLTLLAFSAQAHEPGQPAASAAEIAPVLVGSEFPELTLKDGAGEPFDLNAAIASKPSVIIIYRGGW